MIHHIADLQQFFRYVSLDSEIYGICADDFCLSKLPRMEDRVSTISDHRSIIAE